MGSENRRAGYRIPLQMFMNQHVADRSFRCMATNLSPSGLYVNSLAQLVERERPQVIGLEFELPEVSETIWARGEVRYDKADNYFRGTGIEITGIARAHQRLIHDYVCEQRSRQLRKLLATIRRNRMH